MTEKSLIPNDQQSMLTDHFLYFFLRLRKGQIRKEVAALNARYPQTSKSSGLGA